MLSTFAHGAAQQTTQYYTSSGQVISAEEMEVAAIIVLFFLMMSFIFAVAAYIVFSISLMKIFKKAGVKPWIAWVPFYSNWRLLEIGGQQGFWAVLAIIPVVSIVSAVFMYISMYNVGLKLGKSESFVLFAIFLTPVWFIWLAFDKSVWNEKVGAPSLAPDLPLTETKTAE